MFKKSNLRFKGFMLDKETAGKYKVPFNQKNSNGGLLYGDLIWCANRGVLIKPDYYNCNKILSGMHGYADMDTVEGQGLLVIMNCKYSKKNQTCNLIDICPTLCDLLNIPKPMYRILSKGDPKCIITRIAK